MVDGAPFSIFLFLSYFTNKASDARKSDRCIISHRALFTFAFELTIYFLNKPKKKHTKTHSTSSFQNLTIDLCFLRSVRQPNGLQTKKKTNKQNGILINNENVRRTAYFIINIMIAIIMTPTLI